MPFREMWMRDNITDKRYAIWGDPFYPDQILLGAPGPTSSRRRSNGRALTT